MAENGVGYFEKSVRPLLANRCVSCHSGDEPKSGLRLDTVAGIRKGGKRGMPLIPGKPAQSLLIRAVQHDGNLKMPPLNKLPAAEVAILTAWVQAGAAMPASDFVLAAKQPASARHWAFQPIENPTIPRLAGRQPANPIDAFIQKSLIESGLRPASSADKRTWLRRVSFDLVGLPPTPEEIEAFFRDDSPDAPARVVDRLLASPHYGERWGRHWLDLARYADSNGMDENLVQANAWRYRDYVVDSFNSDKAFNQFILEQIAGDLLPAGESHDSLIATGFLSLGPKMLAEDDPVKMQMDIVDEQIDTIGKAFLGMTFGCARCHDHKFDPISMSDYYALAGIFKSTKVMDHFKVVARWSERSIATKTQLEARRTADEAIAGKRIDVQNAERILSRFLWANAGQYIALVGQAHRVPTPALPREKGSVKDLAQAVKVLRDEKAAMEKAAPALPEAMAAAEGKVENLRIHLRGNHLTLGAEIRRGVPQILAGAQPPTMPAKQSGRLQFAEWLASPGHPLTARVIVNRVWNWHFGAGLVRSTDNFGVLGDKPSHPELLDWLARQFIEDGWSIKTLHRRIVLSETYWQSTKWSAEGVDKDPENRLLWRFNRQRLDAESVRDALLAAGGNLDRAMRGSLMQGNNRAYVPGYPNGIYDRYDFPRRSIYLPVVRSMLYDVFQAFDFADPSTANGERVSTTVAPQALFAMNSKLMHDQSRNFAERLIRQSPSPSEAIRRAYEIALGRPPSMVEVHRAEAFLKSVTTQLQAQKLLPAETELRSWQSFCRALLSCNEFFFIE